VEKESGDMKEQDNKDQDLLKTEFLDGFIAGYRMGTEKPTHVLSMRNFVPEAHLQGMKRYLDELEHGRKWLSLTEREAHVVREALAAEASVTDWAEVDRETLEAVIAKLDAAWEAERGSL